jgi:hypothetical protein
MSKLGVTPWDIVRVQPMEAGGFIDANPLTDLAGPIRKFIDENGIEKDAILLTDSAGQKDTLHQYLPSLYTGGMRKLMQVSHLRGASQFGASRHDLFLAEWADTYGIWISSPIDGVCIRWVIRICSSGIFRIPINFSQPMPDDWEAQEAAAWAISEEEAANTVGRWWSAGDFVPGLAEQIGDVPLMYSNGEGGFFTTCGWAFNARGTSAVNTGVRIDPDDPMDVRLRSSLYRVDITEGAGINAGMPVSASCTLVESGELVNQFDDTDQDKGPAIIQIADALVGERGFCRTFSCYPGLIGPRLFSTSTPVFAYYDPADALHAVRFTPSWEISTSSSSSTMDEARGGTESFPDIFEGDYSMTASIYGGDSAWPYHGTGYPSSIFSASWGSASETSGRTMRFTSLLVAPTGISTSASKVDSTFQTYGGVTAGGSYVLVFLTIDWDVTQINLNTGAVTSSSQARVASADSSATSLVSGQGVITKSRSYSQQKLNHQVLILHGYDRTSYAIYTRQTTNETGVTVSYGGTNMAVPDASTFKYSGLHSGNVLVDHKMSSYNSDSTTDNIRTIKTCVGVSKIPSGIIIYRPDGLNSISPPTGGDEPDVNITLYFGKAVVGGTAYDVDFDSTAVEDVYLDHNFFYKAGGSFNTSRAFYQDKENLTGANVVGVGSYGAAVNRLTCFVGWF